MIMMMFFTGLAHPSVDTLYSARAYFAQWENDRSAASDPPSIPAKSCCFIPMSGWGAQHARFPFE